MDNELLNKIKACKSGEELKALLGDRRLLTEDETEQIVGGVDYFSTHEDIEAFCTVVEQYIIYFGMDVAVEYVLSEIPSADFEAAMRKDGVDGLRTILHVLKERADAGENGVFYGGYNI